MFGVIKQEIVKSRYFSISVDFTPDITRTDQLTIIIRRLTIRPVFSGLVPVNRPKIPVFHSVSQHG